LNEKPKSLTSLLMNRTVGLFSSRCPHSGAKRRVIHMTSEEDIYEFPTTSRFTIEEHWIGSSPNPSLNHSLKSNKTDAIFSGRFKLPFHFESDCMNPPVIEALESFDWMSEPANDLAFESSSHEGGGHSW
jgi:hypothetical protein